MGCSDELLHDVERPRHASLEIAPRLDDPRSCGEPQYFAPQREPPPRRHPVLALLLRIGKNLLGALFVGLGVAMLILPGQGILTILIGLSLLEFPYKRRLELYLISRPPVLRAVNWIRGSGSTTLIVPGVQTPEE